MACAVGCGGCQSRTARTDQSQFPGFRFAAGAALSQFVAVRLDAQAFRGGGKAEPLGDAVFEQLDVLVLELDDPVAIHADEVVVVRVLDVVRVVKFVVLAEVHLLQDAAFDEQRQRAIDGRARDGAIDFARHESNSSAV